VSRIAYFDCAAGAAGDMVLGALLDLGLPMEALRAELAKLALGGYEIRVREVQRAALRATKLEVVIGGEAVPDVEHDHSHAPHAHDHEHGPDHHPELEPHAHGRSAAEIIRLIETSGLSGRIKERSIALFRRLAEAEAGVHGTTPDKVHFHEVGAVDSIVDIVGSVWGLDWLGVDRFVSSPLNVGGGVVRMSHGTYPVPSPATTKILEGAPIYGEGSLERVTPTGALLITGHASSYGPLPLMRLEKTGHGAGTRDTPQRPNVLRILVGEEDAAAGDRVLVLEAELDDASPQLLGALLERLLEMGVRDAYLTPVQMKKSRPGVLITVLAAFEQQRAVEELLFRETTTLGVRRHECERTILDREIVSVPTAYGSIGVKVGRMGGAVLNAQPEFEDCRRAAQTAGVPVKEVLAAAIVAYRERQP
jgi:pyridinium-3,5-bisthiocarboxylic acid mononucleotide nickel chelatase